MAGTIDFKEYFTKWSTKTGLLKSSKTRDFSLIFIIVFFVLCYRRYDGFFNPQLWSEDGTHVLSGYAFYGVKSLIFPIDQYLFLVAHTVGVFFGLLQINLLYIPLCYNISAFLITYFVATRLWNSANYLNLNSKILYATVFLIVPVGPDMFMNMTNIQWITVLYMINYLFVGYQHENKYLSTFLMFFFAFNGPFCLILTPIVCLIIIFEWKKIRAQQAIVYAIIFLSAIVSYITLSQTSIRHRSNLVVNPTFLEPAEHRHLLQFFIKNVADIFFLNRSVFKGVPRIAFYSICLTLIVCIAVFSIYCYTKIQSKRKYILPATALLTTLSYIVAFWPNESKLTGFMCARYYFIPYTCMAWIFILGWDKIIKIWHIVVYMAFFLLHGGDMRSILYDKQWKRQVLEYYNGERDSIEINEGGEGWGRQVYLPHFNKKQK